MNSHRRIHALTMSFAAWLLVLAAPAAAARQPDLTVVSVVGPATAQVGTSAAFGVNVRNSGRRTAGRSHLRLYLSPDPRRSRGDVRIPGDLSVPELRAGRTFRRRLQRTVPALAPPGLMHVIACGDIERKVREARERNNCRATAGRTQIAAGLTAAPPPEPPPPPTPTPSATPAPTPSATPAPTPSATPAPTPSPTPTPTPEPSHTVFAVEAPRAAAGISTPITIWTIGLDSDPAAVGFRGPAGEEVVAESFAATAPDRVRAVVPAGLYPGAWDVWVSDGGGGIAFLADGLEVIDDSSPVTVSPTAVSSTVDSEVEISGSGFAGTPRAYLVRSSGEAVELATERPDPTTSTARVPAGLEPGTYGVAVVDPTGSVGVAPTLEVVSAAPPVATGTSPAKIVQSLATSTVIEVTGAGFSDPAATLDCAEGEYPMGPATAVTPASFHVTLSTAPARGTCLLEVTNGDGTTASSPPRIDIVASSEGTLHSGALEAGSNLISPRRAPGFVAVRRDSRHGRLYAIGGDGGTPASANATVESSPLGPYSVLGAWRAEPASSLPAPRTLAGAVALGRFVYVIGGTDGTDAQASVLRAEVLDPDAAPRVVDHTLAPAGSTSPAAGSYAYSVSAVFPPDHPDNPDGESLPGPPHLVDRPAAANAVTLQWAGVPGASGYRIYRTAAGADPASAVRIADVPGSSTTTYTDSGTGEGTVPPIEEGSLGEWREVAAMNTPRESPAVTLAPDSDSPSDYFLYAAGGRNGSGTYLSTYEFAPIAVGGDGSQTVGTFTNGLSELAVPRAEIAAATAVDADPLRPGTSYVYFWGGGQRQPDGSTPGTATSSIEAGVVGADGQLACFGVLGEQTVQSSRGGALIASDGFLFAFYGSSVLDGQFHTGGGDRFPTATTYLDCPSGRADLDNRQSTAFALNQKRTLYGLARDGRRLFFGGGLTNDGVTVGATDSVEHIHY